MSILVDGHRSLATQQSVYELVLFCLRSFVQFLLPASSTLSVERVTWMAALERNERVSWKLVNIFTMIWTNDIIEGQVQFELIEQKMTNIFRGIISGLQHILSLWSADDDSISWYRQITVSVIPLAYWSSAITFDHSASLYKKKLLWSFLNIFKEFASKLRTQSAEPCQP